MRIACPLTATLSGAIGYDETSHKRRLKRCFNATRQEEVVRLDQPTWLTLTMLEMAFRAKPVETPKILPECTRKSSKIFDERPCTSDILADHHSRTGSTRDHLEDSLSSNWWVQYCELLERSRLLRLTTRVAARNLYFACNTCPTASTLKSSRTLRTTRC